MNLLYLRYESQMLGKNTAAYVLVPPPCAARFPVMLLLHGLWGDSSDWQRKTSIERYADGQNFIIVMPDAGRSYYLDSYQGENYGRAIGEELPELIDSYFPTRKEYCVTGLSMGGYGAVRLALTYPERFVSAASHSGAFYVTSGHPQGDPDVNTTLARILGPGDHSGGPNDLMHLSRVATKRPALRLDCGIEDRLIENNRELHRHLDSIGYAHEYEEFEGAHTWDYWDRHVPESIAFHKRQIGF
jgi:S-formylglutathione hydrolase FrmB